MGKLHFLTLNQPCHLFVEQFQVNHINGFQILLPIFIHRHLVSIQKVIIHGYWHGVQTAHHQLYFQSLRKCCLSGRGGTGNQNQSDRVLPAGDSFCHPCNLVFLMSFSNPDQLPPPSFFNAIVQFRYIPYSQGIRPLFGLPEDPEQFGVVLKIP